MSAVDPPEDPLRAAISALRRHADGSVTQPSVTRARIIARTQGNRARRQLVVRVSMALVGLMVVPSAWAAMTGRLPFVWRALTQSAREESVKTTPPPPVDLRRTLEASASAAAEPVPDTPTPARKVSLSANVDRKEDREEPLYRVAYRAHFVLRDPKAALDGWDAYLAAFPRGRLIMEASYNRALCLIRLKRRGEAIAALTPFVDGSYGDYRRSEAQNLIEALDVGGPK